MHKHEALIVELFQAVDERAWDRLPQFMCSDHRYERPGYPPFEGLVRLLEFYTRERVIASGVHHLEGIVVDEERGACWGRFIGHKKDGTPVDELFSDSYVFLDGKIQRRRSHFFRPAI